MKKIFQWITLSSADPKKYSLSVKMALLAAVPYILGIVSASCGIGLVCIGLDAEGLNQFIQVSENIVLLVLSLVSAVGFVYGFLRKLYLSALGENKVVEEWSRYS